MSDIKILKLFLQSLFLTLGFPFQGFCLETDTINSTLSIKDPDSIVSPGHVFKLGFFAPENTTNRYLAIFYTVSEKTVIWVANRDKPLTDSSGTVTISTDGNLVLKNGRNDTVWSTNAATTTPTNTNAQIQDTGNLVLRDISTGNVIWDSFTHPSNVFVPTMRMIDDINTGNKLVLSAWKSESDPEMGSYTAGLEALNIPQMFVWHNGRPHWRSGPWDGRTFTGAETRYSLYMEGYKLVNDSGIFYVTTDATPSIYLMKFSINSSGTVEQTLWNDQKKSWDVILIAPENENDVYGKCGPFGICNVHDLPVCSCLKGFEPLNKDEWERGNWTGGCARKKQLQCDQSNNSTGNGDGFLRLQSMKVPDFAQQFPARVEEECRSRCLRNCSCIAYTHDKNIGCMFWSDRLIDIRKLSSARSDLYIRLESSELLGGHKDKKLIMIIPTIVGFVCISVCLIVCCWMTKKKEAYRIKSQKTSEAAQTFPSDSTGIVLKDDSEKVNIEELPLFTFETLAMATNQFHDDNLLGEGGFGPVYMGQLANGKQIGVKRLSAASGQGAEEFMNEVIVISKLQHRNLVRLVGCCVERQEKMLIYEYMPNKSLDICLFDPSHPSQKLLDWRKRFSIIKGIGRGLLYLHKDSRLRIIHRDLKLSNVLLDSDWNPKISDFGMARIFGGNQDQANTTRVVGTYGYMAPEYAVEGRFSEKSDVYSFGVLMLEIVSGKKNAHYYNQDLSLSLLGCAWKFWNEDNGLAFVDQTIASSTFQIEMVRCIHIALLCIQEFPKDRPDIQTALSMLGHEVVDLPVPEQPVFAEKWNRFRVGSTNPAAQTEYSINEMTVSVLDGR